MDARSAFPRAANAADASASGTHDQCSRSPPALSFARRAPTRAGTSSSASGSGEDPAARGSAYSPPACAPTKISSSSSAVVDDAPAAAQYRAPVRSNAPRGTDEVRADHRRSVDDAPVPPPSDRTSFPGPSANDDPAGIPAAGFTARGPSANGQYPPRAPSPPPVATARSNAAGFAIGRSSA